MASNHELKRSHESPTDDRLSTENFYRNNDIRRGSETIFSLPDITPSYQNDPDLERGIEKLRRDNALEEIPSTESHKGGGTEDVKDQEEYRPGAVTRVWGRYRPFGHAIIWLLLTAYIFIWKISNGRWWICGLILHRDKWLIPFLLYLAVTLWLIFRHAPISAVSKYFPHSS